MPPLPDILLFLLVPLACVVTGIYFATERSGREKGVRSGVAIGISTAATLAALLLVFLPGEAYYLGLKGLVPALLIWLVFPLLAWNILPGIVGPTIGSPLAYLQHRFGQRTMIPASVVYVVGRILLSSLVLAALARMLSVAIGEWIAPMGMALGVGLLATGCGAACGRRGGTWMSAMLAFFVAVSIPFAIATIVKLSGGPEHIWEVGQASQRTWIGDPTLDAGDAGVVWNLLPLAWVGLLVLLLADEATAARLAQLRSAASVRTALITLLVFTTFLAIAWMYTGLGLFAYYRDHPRAVRPKWVTNVEPTTRGSRTHPKTQKPILDPATGKPVPSLLSEGVKYDLASGTPILPWEEADVRVETIDQLVREGRVYGLGDSRLVLDETGERIDPTKLAVYSVPREGRPSEMLLHRRATEELWPYFFSAHAPPGMRGLLLGGLLAAALAAIDMTAVMGAASLNRAFPSRTESSQRVLATLASLGVMLLGMLFAFVVPYPGDVVLLVLAGSLTPIAALVMLGLTSRRATSGVALATLAFGLVLALTLAWAIYSDSRLRVHPMWSVTIAFVGTFVMGHLLSVVFGESRRRGQLRGLVLGPIAIGSLRDEEATLEIDIPDASQESERWR